MASSTLACESSDCRHIEGSSTSSGLSAGMKSPSYISCSVNSRLPSDLGATMASRLSPEVRHEQGGFEAKGVFLLVVCGLYAVLMFGLARILSYLFARITAPVVAIFFSASVTEVYPEKKRSTEYHIKVQKVPRNHTRSLCHG